MVWDDGATPLIALEAIAIDCETTGLDPRKAWTVEFAAVRLAAGRPELTQSIQYRLKPGAAIPASATRIHGIDEAAVSGAPTFSEVWPELDRFIGRATVIGHTIGFDLAVLERECRRAGVAWSMPRRLDVRLLAEIVQPSLPDYSLETVAAWLGIDTAGRHSAYGDAVAAARIFAALVPRLRDCKIRTLAEAERASRQLTEGRSQHPAAAAAGAEPIERPEAAGLQMPQRVDSSAYVRRIREAMSAPARFVSPDTLIGHAVERMSREKLSSLFVSLADRDNAPRPAETGVITERDVMRALAAHGGAALQMPVDQCTSRPLAHVPADAFVYLAIARMSRLNIRHLGVTDERGVIVGALSARDLLRSQGQHELLLRDEIEQATSVAELARSWAGLPAVVGGLLAEGVRGLAISALISRCIQELTQRAAILAEQRMRQNGKGDPPCGYAFAVLGSAGRGESLLAMDQDNAVVFASGAPGGAEDLWFAEHSTHVADILHEVGIPYCTGGVMAKNPDWRGSIDSWQGRIAHWLGRARPQDLLSVDIFFDLRGVHGDVGLADAVWRRAFDQARGNAAFAKLLAETAGATEPALGWFGRLKTKQGRVDLKKTGLFGIVTAARVLAICHHVLERSTPARLSGVAAVTREAGSDLDALNDALEIFVELILRQQIEDMKAGVPPTNAVAVSRLSRRDRNRLRAALAAVEHLDDLTRELLF
jgi:CBS domain-containing protein